MVGEGIAYALKEHNEVTIADHSMARLQQLRKKLEVDIKRIDAKSDPLAPVMNGFDAVSGALPGRLGMKTIKEACKAGVNLVDNSFMEEDFYSFSKEAKDCGITIVPDSGIAPGLSNIIVGRVAADYKHLEDVDIKVGGVPETNIPPLGYKVVFSPLDTLDEFTRKVAIVKNWKVVDAEPGDGLEYFFVDNLGSMESFYTNGLRSLLRNIKARNMSEKTVRYRGHLEKIKFLKEMGLLADKPIDIDGGRVSPKEVLAALFLEKLSFPNVKDVLYMEIRITPPDGKDTEVYTIFDKMDEKTGFSAMTRTTGFTNASMVRLLLAGKIKEKGIVAPEIIGRNHQNFKQVLDFLRNLGVTITHSSVPQ